MRRPPDLKKSERATSAKAAPNSLFTPAVRTTESDTSPLDLQARSLRRRFALAHYLAVTVAQLVWGGLPR